MKRLFICVLFISLLTACAGEQENNIKIYTRDNASGTREAFESIINLESLSDDSAETSGNGDMAKQVGTNENGIGYVSLSTDFEANNLKPLNFETVKASIESVNILDYKLARPFSFVSRESGTFDSSEKEELVIALLDYLEHSIDAREMVLSAGGIVDVKVGTPWSELQKKHPITQQDNSHITIKTGGSTSVSKTLDQAVSYFIPLAGNFNYEPNHTGSGDGFKRTLGSEKDGANKIDIGFASREFKEDENTNSALRSGVYTQDAVVVVVHKNNNSLTNVSATDLVKIFSGVKIKWADFD